MIQDTSLQAYETEVRPTLGARQWEVKKVLADHVNMTNAEISRALGWEINRVTPRVNELVKMGYVEAAGKRLCMQTGRRVYAWHLKQPERPSVQGKIV